jgi:dienelactone hydrolase
VSVLDPFAREPFTADGKTRDVYRRGTGPAVIVIAEVPGITPKVVEFADLVVGIGCTAVLPHLFGDPGREPSAVDALRVMASGCVSRDFSTWATGRTSPVVTWLRALAASEHERCGGPGVGAVGMCFTGGFALAMATDPRLLAPVLSQPSLPFAVTGKHKRSIDTSPADLAVVKQRCAAEGLQVLGLRFTSDRAVPKERFDLLRHELGDAFVAVELDDDAAPPGTKNPHSVLTEHRVDAAVDQVLELFRSRLLPTP